MASISCTWSVSASIIAAFNGGSSSENDNHSVTLNARIIAEPGATVFAGPRYASTPLQIVPGFDRLALYVLAAVCAATAIGIAISNASAIKVLPQRNITPSLGLTGAELRPNARAFLYGDQRKPPSVPTFDAGAMPGHWIRLPSIDRARSAA